MKISKIGRPVKKLKQKDFENIFSILNILHLVLSLFALFLEFQIKDRNPCLEFKVISDLLDPCPHCAAVLLRGMKPVFCCNGNM